MPMGATVPVSVLTGFLGSGKTTVLNHLLKQPDLSDTVVIINEFGDIALDHLLIERTSENIALLRSGCVCCAVRGDLVETLRDLALQRTSGSIVPFSRVVIETTGLADPAPILHTLMVDPGVVSNYRLEGVITTIDGVNGAGTFDVHDEAVKQAAVADRILLTKCDLSTPESLVALRARLRRINRSAPLLEVENGSIAPREIFSVGPYDPGTKSDNVRQWLGAEAREAEAGSHYHRTNRDHAGHDHEGSRHNELVRSHSVIIDAPVRWEAFCHWLELMSAMRGEQMLRVKGIVAIAGQPDRPVIVHGVQHIFHPIAQLDAWPSADHRTRLVFITRDLPFELIERTLTRFAEVEHNSIMVA